MITLISSATRAGAAGRRAYARIVPLLAAGALAAGCGSATVGKAADGPPQAITSAAAPAAAASASAAASTPAAASATSASAAPSTPVPTVSGGRVVAGEPACAGWPAGAVSAALPVSFVPVSVERCVNSAQVIPGKGLWETATLQRSDSSLAALVSALRQPSAAHRAGTVCPALAIIPPEVLLIGADGQELIPRLPATSCGLVQSQVYAALSAISWQPVSVRLIARISGGTAPTVSGTSPRSIQTEGGAQP